MERKKSEKLAQRENEEYNNLITLKKSKSLNFINNDLTVI